LPIPTNPVLVIIMRSAIGKSLSSGTTPDPDV